MPHYTLSRSSRLYKFVFGAEEGQLEGFPEPKNDRISLGLFVALLITMVVMRPIVTIMILLMEAMMKLLCFLVDGSYTRGTFMTRMQIIQIKPWPTFGTHRLSPWFVLALIAVGYHCWYGDFESAAALFGFFAVTTFIFGTITPDTRSPAEELAEAIDPVIDRRLHLAYYKQPRIFPELYLVV
ncbi:MAG: hypothetical protein WDZ93_02500 [Candidatus Paceibacterota bacterium]